MKSFNTSILALSLPLAALVMFSSVTGIFTLDFYVRESVNWQTQAIGQDRINLFLIAPALIITCLLIYRNIRSMNFIWAGVVLYLVYTYLIFCFSVHFNRLFIIYCLILGLSFYSLVYFVYAQTRNSLKVDFSDKLILRRAIGTYFIVISILFYLLWLAEIVPAVIRGRSPQSVVETGLFTNPVHSIDLSVFLPGIFITGVLLLRGNQLGIFLTPIVLTFFVLMDITIAYLVITMRERGLEGSLTVTFIMGILLLISLSLLIWYLKEIKNVQFKIITHAKQHVMI